MQPKFYLDKVEVMITNICNLNCPNCNRYNNYMFSGFRTWKKSKKEFEKWASKLDLGHWVIIGGEPTTNKDFRDWLKGMHTLWPNAIGQLETNGTLLDHNDKELYDFLKSTDGKVSIRIGLHNINWRDSLIEYAVNFLDGELYQNSFRSFEKSFLKSYCNIKSAEWPECKTIEDWHNLSDIIKSECSSIFGVDPNLLRVKGVDEELKKDIIYIGDKNNVSIIIALENKHYQSSVIHDIDRGTLTLHGNDINDSHAHCMKERGDAFQLIDGNIYKCAVSLSLPHFNKQFPMEISEEDTKTIHSYNSANLNMSHSELTDWFDKLKNPIGMCKFCNIGPELEFSAGKKKIFFKKRKIPITGID